MSVKGGIVPERITQYPSFKRCAFFYIRYGFYFVLVFIFINPAINVFSAEHPKIDEDSSYPKSEPVYIIPDQSDTPLKFGVAITPDLQARFPGFQSTPSQISPFNDNYRLTQHADVSTVVRIALDEFKCFSGLNHWIHDVEKKVDGYSRKFKLTGELNVNKHNTDPVDYIERVNFAGEIYKQENVSPTRRNKIQSFISQFEMNKVTWNIGVHINSRQILFKLGIGDAIIIQSFAGEDVKIGAMIKLSI